MRNRQLCALLACIAVLALAPALYAAEGTATAAVTEKPVIEGTCTITIDCECVDVPITCSGATGTCYSGGTGCDEWIQCGSASRQYCPDPPTGCGSLPECFSEKQCDLLCDPYPGICNSQGCCICL